MSRKNFSNEKYLFYAIHDNSVEKIFFDRLEKMKNQRNNETFLTPVYIYISLLGDRYLWVVIRVKIIARAYLFLS